MDDGETQESLTMSLSNAEDAPPSLPKMHSLVQCRTENYWEIESSGENWLRFIKASSEPPFESQASDESEQESNKSKVFATIASTEPRTQASTDSAAKEMIIQLEVCFVTDIGYLLAVKAMEDSHGKLYTMRKEDYAARSRKLLTHRKLHLMRPGDKICYIQGNDQLLMEYKCETVIETSHSQNLGRESLSYLDNTQETDVPITQRDVRKSHDGIFFTQDHDPDDPYSQTTKESVVPPKTDVSLQQANKTENVKVIDDAIMSQASSGDTTIDPDEVQEDTISPKGAQSSKRARESPTSVDTEDDNGEFGPSLTHKEPPQSAKSLILSAQLLNDQKPATRDEMKESSGSLTVQKEKKTPIGDEVEDSSDLLVSESLHNHNGTLKPAPTLEQLPELMNDCKTPGKDDFAQPPDAQPQREKAKEPSLGDGIKESSDLFVSDLVNNAASKAKEVVKHSPAVMKDRETETSGSQAVKSDKAKETPINDRSPDAMNDREIPGGEVEESPSLFAPTQPADLFSAATNGEVSHPLSPDDTQIKKQSNQSSTRKRAFVVSDRVTPLKTRSEPVRMTRSRTGSAVKHPRSGGKSGKGPQILVTGYEVDSIMEELVSKIGGTIIHDLSEAKTATHVVAKDLKRTIKLMIGLCCTDKIVSLEWLRASAESETPLPCNSYLVIDRKLSNKIINNLQRGKVLEQCRFYFCDSITKPPPNECRLLVEAAGGTMLTDRLLSKNTPIENLFLIRKGSSFSRKEKALCMSYIDAGAAVWTLEELLATLMTQSRAQ